MALSITKNIILSYANSFNNLVALQKIDNTVSDIVNKTITVENIYAKITKIEGNNESVKITMSFFNKKDGDIIDSSIAYTFVPNVSDGATNFIKQGYEYLKTLSEYSEAIDLLDEGQTV